MRAVAEEMFDVDPAGVALIPKLAERDQTAQFLLRLLLAEAEAGMPGTSLMTETVSRALMVHALRRHSNLAPQPVGKVDGMSPGRVRRVIEHMRAHLDQTTCLAELAQVGGLSPSRFSRAFRTATGRPPYRYLIELRIEIARQLLERTDLPITEVALRCGFDQPSHFAAIFRKVVGLSPRSWRTERRA